MPALALAIQPLQNLRRQPESPTQQPTQQQPPAGQRQPSPAATARAAKMALAAGLPPDPATFGSAAGTDALSDAAIMGMSDDEIAALPAATKARLKGM